MASLNECLQILDEISNLEDNSYKRRAYLNAISILKQKGEESFSRRDHFKDIPGIGKSIEEKLLEYKNTGTISKLDKLRKLHPNKLNPNLFKIRDSYITKRIPRKDAMKFYDTLKDILKVSEEDITLCGSARRKSELVGDLDIVICTKKSNLLLQLLDRLKSAGYKITVSGTKKLSFIIDPVNMIPVDIYISEPSKYWFMVLFLTGSKNFNIKMRANAKRLGFKLDQYGLWDKKNNSVCNANSEKDIFDALNMPFVYPENR